MMRVSLTVFVASCILGCHVGQCVKVGSPLGGRFGWTNKLAFKGSCACVRWGSVFNKVGLGGVPCTGRDPWECDTLKGLFTDVCMESEAIDAVTGETKSYCIVDRECANSTALFEDSQWATKECHPSQGDTRLRDMSVADIRAMATRHQIDAAALLSLGSARVNRALEETSAKELNSMKARGVATFIGNLSGIMEAKTKDMLLVKGNEVWKWTRIKDEKNEELWEQSCVDGCSTDGCECLNWNSAYTAVGGGLQCESAMRPEGIDVKEYCAFIDKINTNMCFNSYSQESYQGAHCIVSNECSMGQRIPHTDPGSYRYKHCDKGQDMFFEDMSIAELEDYATRKKIDLSILLGYTSIHKDKSADELSPAELDETKELDLPVMIWSNDDARAERLLVKGKTTHSLTYTPESDTKWVLTCKEGCL